MANAPPTEQAMETYRNLMWEIKFRIDAIDDLTSARLRVRAKIAEEYCYLQLRMICEVMAIACLVIHGNLKPKADLLKTCKADWIMSELTKLHPNFYPTPLEPKDFQTADGPGWVNKTSCFLTKEGLQNLWRRSGEKLHRGSVKNILAKERPMEFPKVIEARNKILSLLERHIIATPDEEWVFYVIMYEAGTGNVASNLLKYLRPASADLSQSVRPSLAPKPEQK